MLIVLVTPNSQRSQWLYYEAGIAAGHAADKLVPLHLGLKAADVGSPLDQHQMYNLASKSGFTTFVTKMLHAAGFQYSAKLHDALRNETFEALVEAEKRLTSSEVRKAIPIADVVANQLKTMSEKIDRNFAALSKQLPDHKRSKYYSAYDVELTLVDAEENDIRMLVVSLDSGMTAQEFLNEIYYKMSAEVEEYSYLSEWVVADPATGRKFVFREIGMLIPAEVLFEQGKRYEIRLLESPYDPTTDTEPEYLD